jgi:hypothetical protein
LGEKKSADEEKGYRSGIKTENESTVHRTDDLLLGMK